MTEIYHPGKSNQGNLFYGYIVAIAAFLAWMAAWGTQNAFGVFFKPLLTEFGWTRAMTAGPYSAGAILRGFLGIAMGRLTDKFGPRAVILIFGSFLGIGYLLMSQIRSLWQFYVVYAVIISIGLSTTTIPIMVTIARWFVKRRGLMTGIVQSGGSFGGMILSPLAGWLILSYGWRPSYIILGIIALVFIILGGLFLKREPEQRGQFPAGTEETKVAGTGNPGPSSSTISLSFREAMGTKQFWMLLLMFFSFGYCRSTIVTHIAAHTTDLGFSLTTAAKVLATISGVGMVGRIGMGRMADIIGNRQAFMTSFALMAGILLWLTIARELWMLYLFAAIFGFSWGALAAIRVPILAEVFGLSSLGTILGIIEFGAETGNIVGPFLAGWLFDITGRYQIAFISGSLLAVAGFITTFLLKPMGERS